MATSPFKTSMVILSAANYGKLVGVSMLTIYNWETGQDKAQATVPGSTCRGAGV